MIELMIGIGIVALLISILMPTLARAREHAQRTRCASNLRQIQLACTSYENNWNSSCPWPNWHGPELAGYRPPGWLYQYPQGAGAGSTQNDVQGGALWEYLNSIDVYHCPEDSETSIGGPVHPLTSYLMNGAACGYGKMLPSYKVTYFQADAIMFWEADPTGPAWTAGGAYPSMGITARHNGGSVGCFDGHVEWMSAADFYAEAQKLPGRLWCNPGSRGGN
jgi:hypothetical protein